MEDVHEYVDRYEYSVAWSGDDEAFVATVAEWRGLSGVGGTMVEALAACRVAVQGSIEWILEEGERDVPPPLSLRDYSGSFNVRVAKELHAKLAREAAKRGVSMNAHIGELLGAAS